MIGWNESNRAYILTHGVRGVEWSNYRHPLPEHVYDVYMKYWREVWLVFKDTCIDRQWMKAHVGLGFVGRNAHI